MQKRFPIYREEKTILSKDGSSLPVHLNSFVGREQEIEAICTLLRQPEIRLLTLIGTGGVGKTRLSLQVATQLASEFQEQVYFISLMEISDPTLVIPTIAKTLGLQELGTQPIIELLKAFLQEKQLLLLIDNFEHMIEAAPALAHLLGACTGLKVLATSREVLRVSGEHTFPVLPLALPDLSLPPDKETLLRYPAITLFLERTRTILPEFTLNDENSRTVAEICVHLDGLPLAIELAVPRLKLLSPQMLLERLDHRLQVLTYGMRDAPGRQQTLENTLDWSYRLLNQREQQLFRHLSVFVGGCTLQAVEATCKLAGYQQEKDLILEGVASLLDKSMLYHSPDETEEPRLFLLSTIREYGLQHLATSGETERVQWAHATYFLALAEEAEPELKGPHPRHWLERLEREHDNLREALCFLIAQGQSTTNKGTEMALRMSKALERFWVIGGHVKEGRDLLTQALRPHTTGVSPAIRGSALLIISALARYQGDFSYAAAACEESLAIFRALHDAPGIAGSLYRSGYVAWMRGDPDTARERYEESLAVAHGDLSRDARSETLYCYASMAFFQRDALKARRLIEESLAISRELDDQYNIASALSILGWVSLLQEDITTARRLQEESLAAGRELGNQRGIAHTLSALGEIAYMMEDFALANDCYEESLAIIMRLDDRWVIAIYLEGQAKVAAAQGEAIWAVQLLSTAAALRQSTGASMTPLESTVHEEVLTTLRDLLDAQTFAATWAAGQRMTPEQAVAARHRANQTTPRPALEKPPALSILPPRMLHDDLTQRERDVLRLVALGLTDAQVAERLVISRRTINFHLTSIYRKLQVSSRSAATRYVLEQHLF